MRPLSWLFALALCLILGPACGPRAAPPNPALWRLSDENSSVWLFGTVHVLPPGLVWRTEQIDAALAGSRTLVLETEIGPQAETAFAALARVHGTSPADRTIAALSASGALSAQDRQRLAGLARAVRLDPAALETLRPWLVALQLSLAYAVAQGQSADAGVEAVLLQTAQESGKSLVALETPEQQIRTLADLAPADELSFLRATLRQIEEAPQTLEELDRAWITGDVETLARLSENDIGEAGPGVYEALLTRRNAVWTERIKTFLAGDQDVFVAVGAAHLVGEDSVVASLRAQGFSVEGP